VKQISFGWVHVTVPLARCPCAGRAMLDHADVDLVDADHAPETGGMLGGAGHHDLPRRALGGQVYTLMLRIVLRLFRLVVVLRQLYPRIVQPDLLGGFKVWQSIACDATCEAMSSAVLVALIPRQQHTAVNRESTRASNATSAMAVWNMILAALIRSPAAWQLVPSSSSCCSSFPAALCKSRSKAACGW